MIEAAAVGGERAYARVLGQVPDRAPASDPTGGGGGLAGQDLQEAGLAGPVAAHDPGHFPGAEREGDVGDDDSSGDFDGYPGDLQHGSIVRSGGTDSGRREVQLIGRRA